MKQYTITIPDDKNEFFLELIKSLGYDIREGEVLSMEDAEAQQWQLDIIEQRIKNSTDKSFKNWDDVKNNFWLE